MTSPTGPFPVRTATRGRNTSNKAWTRGTMRGGTRHGTEAHCFTNAFERGWEGKGGGELVVKLDGKRG